VTNIPAEEACTSNGGNFCDGEGHCVGCVTVADCAPTGTVCATVACTGNACVITQAPASTACSEHGGRVCDGKGSCVDCAVASDCPATGTMCATPVCGAGNVCSTTNTARLAACADHGGASCDGDGRCAPASCVNGVKDATETDVDCGGSCPEKCATGKACTLGPDCVDQVCSAGACAAAACTDGVQNGQETDVDCGGACAKCVDTKHCRVDADCVNGDCFGYGPGTCVSCMDGVRDGDETDVDCGGSTCDLMGDLCALGKACSFAFDCVTHSCEGGVCALKPDGQPCTSNDQCVNAHCVNGTECCHTACPSQAPSTCGNDGLCSNDGASCEKYSQGTGCGVPACAAGMIAVSACDGAGACVKGTAAPCPGKFGCASASACATTCATDADCAAGAHCQSATHTCS
jgi:hypothetical protein